MVCSEIKIFVTLTACSCVNPSNLVPLTWITWSPGKTPSFSATEFSSTEETYKPTPCSAPPRIENPNPEFEGRLTVNRLMGYFVSFEDWNCVIFGRSIPESDACRWRLSGKLEEVGIRRRFPGDLAGDFKLRWREASASRCQRLWKISWSLWGIICHNNG